MKRPLALAMTHLVLVLAGAVAGCGGQKAAAPGGGGQGQPGQGGQADTGGGAGEGGRSGEGGQAGHPDADAGVVPPSDGPGSTLDPGTPVTVSVPAARASALAQAQAASTADAPANAAEFASRWKPAYVPALGYDPLQAKGVDLLMGSHLALNDQEKTLLAKRGFVISARQSFPTFFYGYKSIYADDLPLFISADSILHAVHKSYDAILKQVEVTSLLSDLDSLLRGMHTALGAGAGATITGPARTDVDLYLTVARRLLQGPPATGASAGALIAPVAGASPSDVAAIVEKAQAATGLAELPLFGDPKRVIDFSQFKPRGHYVGLPSLEAYFRAMIWLGRTDLRLLVEQKFFRRQFDVSLLLAMLLDSGGADSWRRIDGILRGFVGESDNMTMLDFSTLSATLGAPTLAALGARSDQELAQAITDANLGIQRIASQILFVPPGGQNAPLDRVFLFFGQRFILDSEVLSKVVFDRVLPESGRPRMMPDPLDVAFAALSNTHAAPLLGPQLDSYQNYPAALHKARRLVVAHEPDFWTGSLYHAWLGSLRALSPPADLTAAAAQALPAVAKSEAWSRRILNSQLGSWAELRHDTLLYAKQSYTMVPACEFPDAYVDPYPELWAALGRYAARGLALVDMLPANTGGRAGIHFAEVQTVAQRLEDMARRQLTGQAFTADQLAWVNQAVNIKEVPNCGPPLQVPDGWYVRLFYEPETVKEADPTIADVHTQPGDEGGALVGKVLHVATGNPRLMVMTAETCVGPRAYVGLVSAYHEKVTTDFKRLTDPEWAEELKQSPADVPWMTDLVSR